MTQVPHSAEQFLVTGATGFVGQSLVGFLSISGRRGFAVSRRGNADVPEGWRPVKKESALAGTGNGTQVVVHLEVKQHVLNPTPEDIAGFQEVNVEGTREWLDWCEREEVKRFVYFSTIKAVEVDWRQPGGVSEDQPERPGETPYGRSKWEAEQLVRKWVAADPERSALIIRPAVVYGSGNTANIYAMVDGIARGRFALIGRNDNVKSVVSKRNLAAAAIHLVDQMRPGCEVFYVTDQESMTVREMADTVGTLLEGRKIPTLPPPFASVAACAGDLFTRLSGRTFPVTSSRLKALTETTHFSCEKLLGTGFIHPQTLRAGLEEMVKWYTRTEPRG